MKVLVGECTGRLVAKLEEFGWGRMWIARGRRIYTYPGEPWGLDNGAYRDFLRGTAFDEVAYWRSLETALVVGSSPYLAVVPDIVAGGLRSLDFSLSWVERLPAGWPLYLAVQDGMHVRDVRPHLFRFAGIFLGGSGIFKATTRQWATLAHQHGKRFHYGRAGTPRKIAHAIESGCDSLDSAFPMWTNRRWRRFVSIIQNGPEQHNLFQPGAA